MKAFRYIYILLILSFFSSDVLAQEKRFSKKLAIIERRIEAIAETNEDENLDYTTLLDDLGYFYDHPINLNNTTVSELMLLHILSDVQIKNLLEHIRKNGKLLTIYELQSIKGFDLQLIFEVLPFVSVFRSLDSPKLTFKDLFENGSYEWISRYMKVIEEQEGFSPISDSALAVRPNSRYLGDPTRFYNRMRYRYGNKISLGMTTEKDAGEEFFKGTQPNGFDFYSLHFYVRDIGKIKNLAIGDFHAQFGQGLTFWSGLGFGKSAEVMSVKKNASIIRPYSSVDENVFLRGAATTVELSDFEITAFVSQKNIDANITSRDTLEDLEQIQVSSIQTTGIHNTLNTIVDKDAIGEFIYGGHIEYKKDFMNFGLTAVSTKLDGNLSRNLQVYNQFDFNSNENTNIGFDYNIVYKNFNLFGEVSTSANGGVAMLNGALISLGQKASLSIVQRDYQKDYQSIYSEGFAEGSRVTNEQGIYLGLELKPTRKLTISSYLDQFKFPWLRYLVDAPSRGYEYLVQITYKPNKKFRGYIRYRNEVKGENESNSESYIPVIENKTRENLRFNLAYEINDNLKIRSRVEFSHFNKPSLGSTYGYLAYQDVIYKPLDARLSITTRFSMFDTDDFNSRIYMYENDVLYYFYIPAVYYRGIRNYLLIKYRMNKRIDLWMKLAQTYYSNIDQIGTGLNTIDGNTRTDIKLQMRLRF